MSRKRPLNTRKKLNRLRTAQREAAVTTTKADVREERRRERESRKADSAMKGCGP